MTDLLDEDVLRQLLTEAADAAPAPGRAAEDLLAALTDPETPADGATAVVPIPLRQRLSPRVIGIAAAVVLVVAILGVALAGTNKPANRTSAALAITSTTAPNSGFTAGGAGGITGGTGGSAGDVAVPTTIPPTVLAPNGYLPPEVPAAAAVTPASGTATDKAAGSGTTQSASAAPAPLTDSAKVVKTGSLQLEVRKGGFDGAVNTITTKAIGLGGYVANATTASSSGSPSGTITVRVPSASFDQLLGQLRSLGKVQSVSQQGTEVSAQYTDLQARLSAQTATRDRLNTVLSKASTVQDILAVQDRITEVQTQIEQIQGQIKLLDDQTSMGTLAVSLAEPGAKPPVVPNPDDRTIGSAFSEAWHHFGNGLEAVVAWSGSALAVLLVGLVGLGVARLLWTRFRRYLI